MQAAMPKPDEKYLRLLRDNRFKATEPRIKILKVLDLSPRPLTATEIHRKLQRSGIDLATVYRSVNKLAEAGLLVRVGLGDEFTRFELRREGHRHHIVCSTCGTVGNIERCNLHELLESITKSTGYHNIEHEVLFRGECNACYLNRAAIVVSE